MLQRRNTSPWRGFGKRKIISKRWSWMLHVLLRTQWQS